MHTRTYMHAHTRTHTRTHSRSLSLTLTHSLSLSLSPFHTHTHTHTYTQGRRSGAEPVQRCFRWWTSAWSQARPTGARRSRQGSACMRHKAECVPLWPSAGRAARGRGRAQCVGGKEGLEGAGEGKRGAAVENGGSFLTGNVSVAAEAAVRLVTDIEAVGWGRETSVAALPTLAALLSSLPRTRVVREIVPVLTPMLERQARMCLSVSACVCLYLYVCTRVLSMC